MSAKGEVLACSRCGAIIAKDDLAQGLAVAISGELICPACVDALPADTQARINQLRAVRGLEVTTYRVALDAAPKIAVYTFTSSSQILRHRRVLNQGKTFEAPPLANRNRPGTTPVVRPVPPTKRPSWQEPWRLGLFAGGAVLGGAMAIFLLAGGSERPAPEPQVVDNQPAQGQPAQTVAPSPEPAANDPLLALRDLPPTQAWPRAIRAVEPDHPFVAELAERLRAAKVADQAAAESAIASYGFTAAEGHLRRLRLPLDSRFDDLRLVDEALLERIRAETREPEPEAVIEPGEAGSPPDTGHENEPGLDLAPAGPGAEGATATSTSPDNLTTEAEAEAEAEAEPEQPQQPEQVMGHDLPLAGLLSQASEDGWRVEHNALRLVDGGDGRLGLALPCPAGTWRLWLECKADGADPTTLAATTTIAGTTFPIDTAAVSTSRYYAWTPFSSAFTGDGSDLALAITTSGPGWAIRAARLVPAAVNRAAGVETASTKPITLPEAPAPALVVGPATKPAEAESAVHDLALVPARPYHGLQAADRLQDDGRFGRLALNPSQAQSFFADLPAGSDRLLRIAEHRRSWGLRQVLDPPVDISSGGLALLFHPNRIDRQSWDLRLTDGDGDTIDLTGFLITEERRWYTALVPAPGVPPRDTEGVLRTKGVFNPSRLAAMEITNPSVSLAWAVGRMVAVHGRAPLVADLDLDPPVLSLTPTGTIRRNADLPNARLARSLALVGRRLDGDRPVFLVGHQLGDHWLTALRQRAYIETAALALRPEEALPDGGLDRRVGALMFNDAWLDERFIERSLPQNLARREVDLVFIATAGAELAIGLTVEQAVGNFYARAIRECLAARMLPVIVLGPTKLDGRLHERASRLWQAVATMLAKRHPQLPVIDLRDIVAKDNGDFPPGGVTTTTRRLARAYAELRARLELAR